MVATAMALSSTSVSPLLLIHGGESVLADRALTEALALRPDFERTVLLGSELEPGRYGEAVAPSLFAEKRVVVVKDLQDVVIEVQEEIESLFDHIDPNLHLIFIHKGGVKGKGLLDKIKKLKPEIITCEPMKKVSDKEDFVREEFARHGRKISSAAVTALVDATGSDTRELAAACSQIAFDTNAESMELLFTPVRNLTDEEYELVRAAQSHPDAKNYVTITVAQADKVTKQPPAVENKVTRSAEPEDDEVIEEPVKRAVKKPEAPVAKKSLADVVSQWSDEE